MRRKLTTKEFIYKAKLIHKNKYDYSKVNYINTKTKIIINCHTHGEFQITPNNHLQGKGCPICGAIIRSEKQKQRLTTKKFVTMAKKIHAKYDYSKVKYIDSKSLITVVCDKGHEFTITPSALLSGRGCTKCSSKGYEEIREYFKENKIILNERKTITNQDFKFHFYVQSLNLAIEYNGNQHFNDIYFENKPELEQSLREIDKLKTMYCKNNKIPLLKLSSEDIGNIGGIINRIVQRLYTYTKK